MYIPGLFSFLFLLVGTPAWVVRVVEMPQRGCLQLPPQLSHVHNVFHVSMLHKYVSNPKHIINYQTLEIGDDASYEEVPIYIVDRKEKVLRT